MNSSKISVNQALTMIAKGEVIDPSAVVVEHEIDAMDAFHLRKNGIEVPDELITYDDKDLAYDEDFDDYHWIKLDSPVDETEWNVSIELTIDDKIKEWIAKNNIDLSKLLSSLLHNYYQTDQSIHKK